MGWKTVKIKKLEFNYSGYVKIEDIEINLKKLNFHLGTNDRGKAYSNLKEISSSISDILTFLNTETQD